MLRAILGAGVAAGLVVTMSGVASAAPDTTRVSRTVVGIGSDTTYEVMNALDQVYNQSAGCAIIPPSGGTFTTYKQTCIVGGSLAYDGPLIETENEYHDRIVEAYPVGSGNGATALFQYVDGGSSVALPADFSRSSSKRTLTPETGMTQFESAYARDGISYWVGRKNTSVTRSKNGSTPTPNITSADLKTVFLGDGNPNSSNAGCAINWKKQPNGTKLSKVDSVGNATGTPGSGNIVVYATQTGSGTGKDFANFLQAGKVAADLQDCINPNFTDGTGEQHVIFENNATPICGDGRCHGDLPVLLRPVHAEPGGDGLVRRCPRRDRPGEAEPREHREARGLGRLPVRAVRVQLLLRAEHRRPDRPDDVGQRPADPVRPELPGRQERVAVHIGPLEGSLPRCEQRPRLSNHHHEHAEALRLRAAELGHDGHPLRDRPVVLPHQRGDLTWSRRTVALRRPSGVQTGPAFGRARPRCGAKEGELDARRSPAGVRGPLVHLAFA
jgi:ABC-type phosphate transport system substrate-binding protein